MKRFLPRVAIMLRSLLLTTCVLVSTVPAETFHLRSGGHLQGKLLNPNESPRSTYQIRLDSGGDVSIDAKYVERVKRLTDDELRYAELLKQMPTDSAPNHWQMAEQCRKWVLPRQRKFHLEQVIRLDPDHEPARRALKFKKSEEGKWVTTAEVQKAAGLVRRDGRWVTEQTAQLRDHADEREQAKIEWQKKLKMWRGWLGDRRRQQRALDLIESIEDPLAGEAVARMFWSDKSVRVRETLAEVLGRMDSGFATATLAKAALESDSEMRMHCVRQLKKNGRTSAVSLFLPKLRSKSNSTVRRAGYALGELGDNAIVLPLIKALNTTHKYKSGGGGPGISAGFDPTGRSGGGLSMGGNKPKTFTKTHTNREVLNALVDITKKDFEYSEKRWMAWYLAQTTPPQLDLRRDP